MTVLSYGKIELETTTTSHAALVPTIEVDAYRVRREIECYE